MSEHTKSTVHLLPPTDPEKMLAILTDEGGDLLAYVGVRGMPNEENARRIVALWNACRGISTRQLEIVASYESDEARLSWLGWSAGRVVRGGLPLEQIERISAPVNSDAPASTSQADRLAALGRHPSNSPFAMQRHP